MPENWKQYTDGPNIGLLFYRRIYRQDEVVGKLSYQNNDLGESLGFKIDDENNTPFSAFYKALYDLKVSQYTQIANPASTDKFNLCTTYPGLLIGSGYTHDSNAIGDTKIGFFFDHTSGQPIIPGSSVKGVLRSIFELDRDEHDKKLTQTESLNAIKFFLAEMGEFDEIIDERLLNTIKEEIFGDQEIPGSDNFFDAVIDINKTGNKKIMGIDFITPHKHETNRELDPFVNPNPIQFIKVLPGIAFEFRFRLTNSKKYPNWTSDLKCRLFKTILLTLGIGAKTNVGYGQFSPVNENAGNEFGDEDKEPGGNEGKSILDSITKSTDHVAKKITNGSEWSGHITVEKGDNLIVEFYVDDQVVRLKKKKDKFKGNAAVIGKKVNIKFNALFNNDSPNFTATVID